MIMTFVALTTWTAHEKLRYAISDAVNEKWEYSNMYVHISYICRKMVSNLNPYYYVYARFGIKSRNNEWKKIFSF